MAICSTVDKIYYTDAGLPPPSQYKEGDLMFDIPGEDIYVLQGGNWVLIDAPPAIKYYATYNDLRAATSVLSPMVLIGGRDVVGDGGAGFFSKDPNITLPDNNGTVIYDADGNAWARVFGDTVSAKWFLDDVAGGRPLGDPAVLALYDTVELYHGHRRISWEDRDLLHDANVTAPDSNHVINATVHLQNGQIFDGTWKFIGCKFLKYVANTTSFRKSHIDGCLFDASPIPAGTPPLTPIGVVSIEDSALCENSEFTGGMDLNTGAFMILRAIGQGSVIRNCRAEWSIHALSGGFITSVQADIKVVRNTAGVGPWITLVSANDSSLTSSVIKTDSDYEWTAHIVLNNNSNISANSFELHQRKPGSRMIVVQAQYTKLFGNRIYGKLYGMHGSIMDINLDFGPQMIEVINNTFLLDGDAGYNVAAVRLAGSNVPTVERSHSIFNGNTFNYAGATPVAQSTGILFDFYSGYSFILNNAFQNLDVGISGSASPPYTHNEVYGHSNIFRNVTTPIDPGFPFNLSTNNVVW